MKRVYIIACLSFICLGLPYSILGAAWPAMYADMRTTQSYLGALSLVINAATFLSILLSVRLVHRFTIWNVLVTAFLLSAIAIFGISASRSVLWIIPPVLLLGLGRGTIDASVNSYAALNFERRYINWLHCFWGIGSMLGPILISYSISAGNWANGYIAISAITLIFVIVLLFSRNLWKKNDATVPEGEKAKPAVTFLQAVVKPGAAFSMLAFFCYVSYEMTAGVWAASFLSSIRHMSPAAAAGWAALLYGGITLGRFLSGFLSKYITSRRLIRYGFLISLCGVIIIALPLAAGFSVFGLFLTGFGCGPYYPTMISETPIRFGKTYSPAMVGLQMGSAYIGSMMIPPLTGWLSGIVTLGAYPWILLIFGAGALAFGEKAGRYVGES